MWLGKGVGMVVRVGHLREMTADEAMTLCRKRFAGKYEVYEAPSGDCDFAIRQDGLRGVGVKLEQEKGRTSFLLTDFIPSFAMRVLLAGARFLRIGSSRREAMVHEVRSFLETSPDFRERVVILIQG
jgi:hypothetical protein